MIVAVMTLSTVVAEPHSLGTEIFSIDAQSKPVILKIGNDTVIATAVQTLQHYLGTYRLVPITSEHDLH